MRRTGFFLLAYAVSVVSLSAQALSTPEIKQPRYDLSTPAIGPIRYKFSLTARAQILKAITDPDGNIYFAGQTSEALPATAAAFRNIFAACTAVPGDRTNFGRAACSWGFVGKLGPDGTLLWLTYIPEPNGNSSINQIAIDGRKNVYMAGAYRTVDGLVSAFPVTAGAYETTPGTSGVFIAKLNSSGSSLIYGTYFSNVASINALCPDRDENLYLGMRTESLVSLPLVLPLAGMQPSIESGYLAKLNTAGSGLLFASWVNAPGARSGINVLTLDSSGDLFVTGGCFYDPPRADPCVPTTPGAFQNVMKGSVSMYAMRLHPGGTLVYSTLLSGSNTQGSLVAAVDSAGNLVIAGDVTDESNPIDFPVTPSAFQTTALKRNRQSLETGFITKLDASGSTLIYSTYFGGSSYDAVTGVVLDSDGNIVFSGYSYSPDLPVSRDAWLPCHPLANFDYANGQEADFVAVLSSSGRDLKYASFIRPGNLQTNGLGGYSLQLAGMDSAGDLYLSGSQSGLPVILRYHITSRPQGSAACVADFTHGYESPISPLDFIRIRGNGVAGSRSMTPTLTASGALPMSYQGLQVFIGGLAAPLFEVTPDQITVVVPRQAVATGSALIEVAQDGRVTSELESDAQATTPAVVTSDRTGFGYAAALNQDGSINSHENPAKPGSFVAVFLTGLGNTVPSNVEGTIVTAAGSLENNVQASLYTKAAEVLYAGPAPGLLAGVYQVNLKVPTTVYEDWVALAIRAGGQRSQQEVGIYVSCPEGSTCVRVR